MAYTYNPYYPYQQYQYQQPQQQTIQSGGLVNARSIEEARNYPVAPGNSVTFKIENAPYICTKTQGFSPLDAPVFEKYRLTKEEDTPPVQMGQAYALKSDLDRVMEELTALKKELGYEPHANDSAVSTVSE